MAHDEVGSHMRDELGITDATTARPVQAAWTSALAFSSGALLPLLAVILSGRSVRVAVTAVVAVVALAVLGALGARVGGAPRGRAIVRVVGWSAAAMLVTYLIGTLVGTRV